MTQIEIKQAPSIGYRIAVNGQIYNPMTKDWPPTTVWPLKASQDYFKTAKQEGDLPEGLVGDPRFDS